VAQGSNGAIVIWSGNWPAGNYDVTLEGDGTADLFMQTTGDAGGTTSTESPAGDAGEVHQDDALELAAHPWPGLAGGALDNPHQQEGEEAEHHVGHDAVLPPVVHRAQVEVVLFRHRL